MTGAKCLEFGLELGFTEEEVDIIEYNEKKCQLITREILKYWIRRQGSKATWKILGDALYEIRAGVDFIKDMCQ